MSDNLLCICLVFLSVFHFLEQILAGSRHSICLLREWICITIICKMRINPLRGQLTFVSDAAGMPLSLNSNWNAHACFSKAYDLFVRRHHRHFPRQSPCCGWTCPCGSYGCKTLSASTIRELRKDKIYSSQGLEGLGLHSEVTGREWKWKDG